MANMSYCRFQNTLGDLRDCKEALDFGEAEDLSAEEQKAKDRLIELCDEISSDYGEQD